MSFGPEQLLAVVKRSPELVAVHDRAGWLSLFSDEAVVEDPIGSPPAPKSNGFLGRFWDTFIAPHDIRFEIRRDHFLGQDVFRDALIHTRIGEHVRIDVPAYLLYQLEERGGELRVKRMAAHWQLGKLSLGALKLGPRAWVAMTVFFGRMLRVMGLSWVGGYLSSIWSGIGRRGLDAVQSLARGEISADGAPGKFTVESPVAAGWTVSFRFRSDAAEGLALVEFDRATKKIARARFFAA